MACGYKDTIPPSAPDNLSYKASDDNKQLIFTWDASIDEDSGVYGYLVKTSWEGVMSENWRIAYTPFYANTPQTSGTYVFQVRALDKAGNKSSITSIEFTWVAKTNIQPTVI